MSIKTGRVSVGVERVKLCDPGVVRGGQIVTIFNHSVIKSVYLGDENLTTLNGFELEKGEKHTLSLAPDEYIYAVVAALPLGDVDISIISSER